MTTRETVGHFLREVGNNIGVPLALDEEGACALQYGDGHALSVEALDDESAVLFHAPVAQRPGTDREAFYERVLTTALFGAQTGGCVLGLDPEEGRIILTLHLPVENLDARGFENALANFIEAADIVRERLSIDGPALRDEQSNVRDMPRPPDDGSSADDAQAARREAALILQNFHLRA